MASRFTVIDGRRTGDGGPEDPMLEQRVARLEGDVAEIRSDVREIRTDLRDMNQRIGRLDERMGRMEVGIAKIQSRVEHLPTIWTFVTALIGTSFAAVALVVAVVRALAS